MIDMMEAAIGEVSTGTRIREARQLIGMKQIELADALGISPGAMSMIESNQSTVTVDRLIEIARLTGQNVQWFLPSQGKGDLTGVLKARYPEITPEQIRSILAYADWLASPASRVPPADAQSTDRQ